MQPFALIAPPLALTLAATVDSLAHFVGMLVIIASLIWSAFCLVNYLLRRASPAPLPVATPDRATPRPAAAVAPAAGLSAEIVAVIAAAVYSVLDDKYKIISIKPQDSSWEKAGRQAVLTSHRIR